MPVTTLRCVLLLVCISGCGAETFRPSQNSGGASGQGGLSGATGGSVGTGGAGGVGGDGGTGGSAGAGVDAGVTDSGSGGTGGTPTMDAGSGGGDGRDGPAGETPSDVGAGETGAGDGGPAGPRFVENGGQVVMEAERSTDSAAGTGTAAGASWTSVTPPGSSGTALAATPNVNLNTFEMLIGPRRDYAVQFTSPGTYYVWVRMIGATMADDSLHVGLGSTAATLPAGMAIVTTTWGWANVANGARASVNVAAAGTAIVNLWMREDGVQVDRLLLTKDAAFTPTGVGPAESARQ